MFVQSQMHNKVMPRTFMSFNDLMSLFGQVLFLVKTPWCVRKNHSFRFRTAVGPGNALRALLEALKLFANHCQAKVEHWQGMLSVEHGTAWNSDLGTRLCWCADLLKRLRQIGTLCHAFGGQLQADFCDDC